LPFLAERCSCGMQRSVPTKFTLTTGYGYFQLVFP